MSQINTQAQGGGKNHNKYISGRRELNTPKKRKLGILKKHLILKMYDREGLGRKRKYTYTRCVHANMNFH